MPNATNNNNENELRQSESVIQPAQFKPVDAKGIARTSRIRPVSLIIAVVFTLLVLLLWYVFSARSVYLSFIPVAELVDISGGFHMKVGDRHLMRPGEYQIKATTSGYHPFAQTIEVTAEQQNQTFQFILIKRPGLLSLLTQPEGAQVNLNGAHVGTTPLTDFPVKPGAHEIELIADRYLTELHKFEIEGGNIKQSLAVELTPAWSDISIQSSPQGAQVAVDGEVLGLTPLTLEVMQGQRELSLSLNGYREWRQTLIVIANQPQSLSEVLMEPLDGLIRIASQPVGANVTVNKVFRGRTPLVLSLAPKQNYTISLFKPGYQESNRSVVVKSGKEQQLSIQMQVIVANIRVASLPADAKIYVNGKYHGLANQILSLPTQKQKLEIRKSGYVSYQTYVTPRVGLEQQIKVQLKTLEQAHWEAIKPLITTHDGQQLKLFRPSPFTMGASRREAGRRANEVFRKVNLDRAFYIATKEVTNAQYRRYSQTHSSGHVEGHSMDGDTQPVVQLSWEQAALYCNWLSEQNELPLVYRVEEGKVVGFNQDIKGYRLPTEAEWAWTARSSNNGLLKYPWGAKLPPAKKSGNYADRTAAFIIGRIVTQYDDSYVVTAPVGSFAPSQNALYDMGGNVSEWVHDFYRTQARLSAPVLKNPVGPEKGKYHVVRGSSWAHGSVAELRLSYRDYAIEGRNDLGFRVARYVE